MYITGNLIKVYNNNKNVSMCVVTASVRTKSWLPRGAKLCSPSAFSGSEARTRAFRLPSPAFPGPESKNFMMVETMLRAVLTMARVLVTMLLQISCTPPTHTHTHQSLKISGFTFNILQNYSNPKIRNPECVSIPMSWNALRASLVSRTLRMNHSRGSES